MSPQDFCHWLDGYLQGAEKADAEVIKAKAREISAPASAPMTLQPSVPGMWWPSPTVPQYPVYPIITCSTEGSGDRFEVVDYPPWSSMGREQ